MTEHDAPGSRDADRDLRRDLARLDPATALPAAGRDLTARLLEATMSRTLDDATTPADRPGRPRRPHRQRWLGAAAAAAVLVAGATVAGVTLDKGGDDRLTTVTDGPAGAGAGSPGGSGGAERAEEPGTAAATVVLAAPAAGAGRCMVPTAESVARMELALDATVREVDAQAVTLEVGQWYAGDDDTTAATTVELRNPVELTAALGGVPDFAVGQRWLVSGGAGTVAVCGFTTPWTPASARLYQQAFGS